MVLAPADACALCAMPDSCTHIAGQCSHHNNYIISRQNASCQLTHATTRTAFKGGGTIYPPQDLRLVSSDAGIKNQTIEEDLDAFILPPSQDHEYHSQHQQQQQQLLLLLLLTTDWLNHHSLPTTPHPQRNRRVDMSIDMKTLPPQGAATIHDEEGAAAPRYIPAWALPHEDLDNFNGDRSRSCPRHRLRTRSASRPQPRHQRLQPEGLLAYPRRGRLLHGPRLP